jgi:hypothetical protein
MVHAGYCNDPRHDQELACYSPLADTVLGRVWLEHGPAGPQVMTDPSRDPAESTVDQLAASAAALSALAELARKDAK